MARNHYLETWLKRTIEQSERAKSNVHPFFGLLMSEASKLIFVVAKKLKVSVETKYLGLDLYQRFLLLHIESMTKFAYAECKKTDVNAYMSKMIEKIASQATLRVFTCLWVASKLVDHDGTIKRKDIQKLLKFAGVNVTLNSISSSEMRILNQLKFDCLAWVTIPDHLNLFIAHIYEHLYKAQPKTDQIFGKIDRKRKHLDRNIINLPNSDQIFEKIDQSHENKGQNIEYLPNSDQIFDLSLKLVDEVMLNFDEIYGELFRKITGSSVVSEKKRKLFAKVRSDRILLCVAAITASAYFYGRDQLSCQLITIISRSVVHVTSEDANMLASCIVDHFQDKFREMK